MQIRRIKGIILMLIIYDNEFKNGKMIGPGRAAKSNKNIEKTQHVMTRCKETGRQVLNIRQRVYSGACTLKTYPQQIACNKLIYIHFKISYNTQLEI